MPIEIERKYLIDLETEEVTDDSRYYNSNLTINPYQNWKD